MSNDNTLKKTETLVQRFNADLSVAVLKLDIQQEIRKREHYEKPSVRRKKKSEAARKRKYN